MQKALFYSFLALFLWACNEAEAPQRDRLHEKHQPSEHLYIKHAWPDGKIHLKEYQKALREVQQQLAEKGDSPGFADEWTVRGPSNLGGRINTIAVDPQNNDIVYAGFATGGAFKTTDGGQNWSAIFDQNISLSIGHIAIAPSNSNVIYVGTGDPNISGLPSTGDGVYKSTDGGNSWTNIGLGETAITARIVVDPSDENKLYVATMGLPFERNQDRGLYRTLDGGQNWEKILYQDDDVGMIDLVIDPFNSQTLYVATWERIRNNQESIISGDQARIYKSTDSGDNWTMLENGLVGFDEPMGRIGLAISPITPNTVYAMYVNTARQLDNIYKTTDGGANWTAMVDWDNPLNEDLGNALGGFGWYFGQLRHHPTNEGELYLLGVDLWRSTNDGQIWDAFGPPWWSYEVHADKHDLVFKNNNNILLGTDGGLYEYDNNDWSDIENIASNQIYRVAYNPHLPSWYFGGLQDNGFTGGENTTDDWLRLHGGDGFQPIFHPTDPSIVYSSTQNGNLRVSIEGIEGPWEGFTDSIPNSDRKNWNTPFIMSAHDPSVLYTSTDKVYKRTNAPAGAWQAISDDVTDGLIFSPRFHTTSTLAESPLESGVLYVGTTDGNVWRTLDDGAEWTDVTAGLADRYVTDIKASPTDAATVYVSLSGYKDNDVTPHLFISTDYGDTWQDFSGDLPQIAINDIYVLPEQDDQIIFVATEVGVYGTNNGGENWERLGTNMPIIPVYDLDWNQTNNELIAGTFARSIQTYSLDSLTSIVSATKEPLAQQLDFTLYPNPAQDVVHIKNTSNTPISGSLSILDATGKIVVRKHQDLAAQASSPIGISHLPKGQYSLKWRTAKGLQVSQFIRQ